VSNSAVPSALPVIGQIRADSAKPDDPAVEIVEYDSARDVWRAVSVQDPDQSKWLGSDDLQIYFPWVVAEVITEPHPCLDKAPAIGQVRAATSHPLEPYGVIIARDTSRADSWQLRLATQERSDIFCVSSDDIAIHLNSLLAEAIPEPVVPIAVGQKRIGQTPTGVFVQAEVIEHNDAHGPPWVVYVQSRGEEGRYSRASEADILEHFPTLAPIPKRPDDISEQAWELLTETLKERAAWAFRGMRRAIAVLADIEVIRERHMNAKMQEAAEMNRAAASRHGAQDWLEPNFMAEAYELGASLEAGSLANEAVDRKRKDAEGALAAYQKECDTIMSRVELLLAEKRGNEEREKFERLRKEDLETAHKNTAAAVLSARSTAVAVVVAFLVGLIGAAATIKAASSSPSPSPVNVTVTLPASVYPPSPPSPPSAHSSPGPANVSPPATSASAGSSAAQ
jgi:hypothetical protein